MPGALTSAGELEKLGVKMVIFALSATLLAAEKLRCFLAKLKEEGTTAGFFEEMMPLHSYEKLMGLDEAKI